MPSAAILTIGGDTCVLKATIDQLRKAVKDAGYRVRNASGHFLWRAGRGAAI
jgi:hypothetical protein